MSNKDLSDGDKKQDAVQLSEWKGKFGNQYINRNQWADWKMEQGATVFRRMLNIVSVNSILEVGSNIGINLRLLNNIFGDQAKLFAVEPNQMAFEQLKNQTDVKLEGVWNCDAFQLPLEDNSIDLVFTKGVLIHIAPDDLLRAASEIVRVARRYVLCVEYFSQTPVEIPYRGRNELLFKRDFGAFYLEHFPELRWIDYGFLWQEEFSMIDNQNWWLFEKVS
jgi:pseudaminic acid biosynthesis-associated methylase